MRKLIFLLLFATVLQAQEHLEKLKGEIELNGHVVKKDFWFKANLDGIEIYDKDKNQYQKRKCGEKECKIIHLEPKNNMLINNWQYFANPTIQTTF